MKIIPPILRALPEIESAVKKTQGDYERMQSLLRDADEAMRSDHDPFPFLCELTVVFQNSLQQLAYARDLVEGAETASAFWDFEIAQLMKGNSKRQMSRES
jgi:hypothetical protein